MKKYRGAIISISIIVAIIVTIMCYIKLNRDRLIYEYMLYDHIMYNGNDYQHAKDQLFLPSKSGENRGPVYLVYKSLTINYEKCNTAYVHTGYEGEENEIYLFFDSALYIRGDYLDFSP